MNSKIAFSVFSAFFIVFSGLFIVVYNLEPNGVCRLQNQFYSQEFDPEEKKIVILGASHTDRLNSTHIGNFLNSQNLDYDIYNLSSPSDRPSERLWSIEKIISMKPQVVVYGISFRDFSEPDSWNTSYEKPDSIFPDPHNFFDQLIFSEKYLEFCTTSLKNPKLSSLKIIRQLMGQSKGIEAVYSEEKMPFLKYYNEEPFFIKSYDELKTHPQLDSKFSGINYSGKDIMALKEIIEIFQKNNVKIVVFSTPNHELYLNNISEFDKKGLVKLLEDLHSEYGISVHFLHEKYSSLEIWNDPMHITKNEKGLIFTNDISEIILEEINQNVI